MSTYFVSDAYISATGGLRAARRGAGLTVESVEAAQDAFREELDEMEEVQQALTSSNGDAALEGEEQEDLVAELEALLRVHDNNHVSSELNAFIYDLPDISKLNLGSVNTDTSTSSDVNNADTTTVSRVPILS